MLSKKELSELRKRMDVMQSYLDTSHALKKELSELRKRMAVMQSYLDTSNASWDAISIFDDNSQEASENVTLTDTPNELDSSDMNEDSVLEGACF